MIKSKPGYRRLRELCHSQPAFAIGLMSGTSVDSIDAALIRIEPEQSPPVELIAFEEQPIDNAFRRRILQSMQPETSSVDTLCQLNVEIGERFALAAQAVLEKAELKPEQIACIGSHGQTLYHIPHQNADLGWHTVSTLQLGEPSVIAERTGVITIGDFRHHDMALGGVGAPLVPFFDAYVFASEAEDIICQNIGGISNCTLLAKDGSVAAFDSGPGNMIMDAIMRKQYMDRPYDNNGDLARKGSVIPELLDQCLGHSYFKQPLPKATGHELFGKSFVDWFLIKSVEAETEDLLATACELTAATIVNAYRDYLLVNASPKKAIVSGGGTKNLFLMERLAALCPELAWKTSDEFGIPSGAKEAMAFALLGYATLNHIPSNIPSVTGARKETVLGKIVFA